MTDGDQPARVNIAGTPVSAISTNELIGRIAARIGDDGAPELLTYANAWTIGLARDDEQLSGIHRDIASVVYADGQAVVWASRLLGRPLPERVNAGDFFPALLSRLAGRKARVFFLGGAEGLAHTAAERVKGLSAGITIVGTRSGYFTEAEANRVAQLIRDTQPDIVFVGMGSPQQEQWAADHLDELGASVVWCVGALFEYYGDVRRRAPTWMRRIGLEWLFRLVLEPKRLWRRYFFGNARFLWLVARQKLTGRSD